MRKKHQLVLHSAIWFGLTGFLTAVLAVNYSHTPFWQKLVFPLTEAAIAGMLIGIIMALKYGVKIFTMPKAQGNYYKIAGYGALSGVYAWLMVILVVFFVIMGWLAYVSIFPPYPHFHPTHVVSSISAFMLALILVAFMVGFLPAVLMGIISLLIFYFCFRNYYANIAD